MNQGFSKAIISTAATLSVVGYLCRGLVDPAWRVTLFERFGYGPWGELKAGPEGIKQRLWLHGASVGEVGGLEPICRKVRQDFVDHEILVTTTSTTGQHAAKQRQLGEHACLFPFDHPVVVGRIVRHVRPKLFVVSETELWPSLLYSLYQHQVPVLLVNGRISDFSFPFYYRVRSVLRPALNTIAQLLVQTERDAERFVALGAEPQKVEVAGSTKYDQGICQVSATERAQLALSMGLDPTKPCFVAGSVRPHEDASIISAFIAARTLVPELQMVIAPRHPERFEEVAGLLERYGLEFHRRSAGHAGRKYGVVLLDTLGELNTVYGVGDLAFVGGSLVNLGGHNPLEPAAHGVPVIVGPHTSNVRDAVLELKRKDAVMEVATSDALAAAIVRLCADQGVRRSYGQAAHVVWKSNVGATRRVYRWVRRYLLDYDAAIKELSVGQTGGRAQIAC